MKVIAVTLLLMLSLGLSGYFTLEVWRWDERTAGLVVIGFHLVLATALIRWLFGPLQLRSPAYFDDSDQAAREDAFHQRTAATPAEAQVCPHLRDIECAMRAEGVPLDSIGRNGLLARCHVDHATLRRQGKLEPPVRYFEEFDGRDTNAQLRCDQCGFAIHVKHPMDECPTVFPSRV